MFSFGWMMPLSYAEKLLPNCLIDLMSTWNGQQSFAVNCSRATLLKHSKYFSGYGQSATVRGAGVMAAHRCMAAWPKGCLCMEGNSLPLENKHLTSERQQPLQTWGNASPTSISWLRIHFVLEGGCGLLLPIYIIQRRWGEEPQGSLSAEAVSP